MGMSKILKPRILVQREIKEDGLGNIMLAKVKEKYTNSRILVHEKFENMNHER